MHAILLIEGSITLASILPSTATTNCRHTYTSPPDMFPSTPLPVVPFTCSQRDNLFIICCCHKMVPATSVFLQRPCHRPAPSPLLKPAVIVTRKQQKNAEWNSPTLTSYTPDIFPGLWLLR